MQVARQTFKIAQHLKAGGPHAAGLHRRHSGLDTTGVRDQIARHQHHLRKASTFHGGQLGLQGARHGDGVHAVAVEHAHARPHW